MRPADIAVSVVMPILASGMILVAVLFWWPLISYACHYWFG